MKTRVATLVAVALLVPGLAFAQGSVKTEGSQTSTISIESETAPAPERKGFFGILDIFKTTTKTTVTENAKSDTDFLANHPNPGTTTTTVEVNETMRYR